MTEDESNQKAEKIRQIAYALHLYLGVGFLEKVYENGLAHRLEKAGCDVLRQVPIVIYDDDGVELGNYFADMVVDGLIVELKSVPTLLPVHLAQVINYLKATGNEYGLLINFGSEKFQCRKLAL